MLTPGTNGECGGGVADWPEIGSMHAGYYWHTTQSEVYGTYDMQGFSADQMGVLPASYILPTRVKLSIWTGGGATFGYAKQTFLVKLGRVFATRWRIRVTAVGPSHGTGQMQVCNVHCVRTYYFNTYTHTHTHTHRPLNARSLT